MKLGSGFGIEIGIGIWDWAESGKVTIYAAMLTIMMGNEQRQCQRYLFGTILQNDVNVLFILETMVESDDVGVHQITMQLDLAGYLTNTPNKQKVSERDQKETRHTQQQQQQQQRRQQQPKD